MDLNEIVIFATVVRAESFTAAAHKLAMPKSTVSRKVSELETRLGAQLLQRTTRRLHLTDAGRTYYQYAARIVGEVEEADLAVSRMQELPRGPLRISAPLGVAFLGPIVRSFLVLYPDVQIEMVCTDRVVDLVNEGFDVAIRFGRLADSSLIARAIGSIQNIVVASPAFVNAHGAPKKPKDLQRMPCVVFGSGSMRNDWLLVNKDKQVSVHVASRLIVNDFDILIDATLAGQGVGLLPVHQMMAQLRQHKLVHLLPDWCTPITPFSAVYPSARLLSPKVKTFVDHLKVKLTPPPWELGPKL